jgi:hypothetical protein
MAKLSIPYQRLPGWGYRKEGTFIITVRRTISRLWLGPDHLLCAERAGFTEEYKRFYYSDIQAVIVRRTRKATTVNFVLTTLVLCFTVLTFVGGSVWGWVWGIMDAVLLIPLVINIFKGPTCQTHLKTAVQLEEMPAWGRVRRAERCIARLRERVLEAQGSMAAEEARMRLDEMINKPTPVTPAAEGLAEKPALPPLPPLPPESTST